MTSESSNPVAQTSDSPTERGLLRRFLDDLRGYRAALSVVVALSFVTGLLETVTISLAVMTLASVVAGATLPITDLLTVDLSPWRALQLGVLAALLRWVFGTLNEWWIRRVGMQWTLALRTRLLRAYLGAPWRLQSQERSAAVQERLMQNATAVSQLQVSVVTFLQSAITVMTILAGAFLVSPLGAAAAFAVSGILMLALRPLSRFSAQSSKLLVAATLRGAELMRSCIEMIRELTVFGTKERASQVMERALEEQEDHRRRSLLLATLSSNFYFTAVLLACWGAVAVMLVIDRQHVLSLGAVGLLLLRSLGYTRSLQQTAVQVRRLLPIYDDLMDFQQRLADGTPGPSGVDAKPSATDYELRGVSYRYPEAEVDALVDVDLVVPAGSTLAIVGPSGGGKSTLAQLLLGLRSPTRGELRIGGVPLCDVDAEWLRQRTAVVTQESLLLDATVRENIRLFREHIDESSMWRALEQVGLESFVREEPDGLDTWVGQSGARLSGGQRQRLCIARAVVGDPRVLVLDEPTSALDAHSENVVQECLRRLHGCTRIVIAHRLSTIRECERVVVLEAGRVVDAGSPSELEERLTYFREALAISAGQYEGD